MDLTFDLEPGDDRVYVDEAIEQIERIERGLLELERHTVDREGLAEIFRAAHTLKGSAATIGHHRMTELTHALEDVFGALREGRLADVSAFGDILLSTVDVLHLLVDEVGVGVSLTDASGPLALSIRKRLAEAIQAHDASPDANPVDQQHAEPFDQGTVARLLAEAVPADGPRSVVSIAVDPNSEWAPVRLFQALIAAREAGNLLASVPSPEEIESGTGGSVLTMLLRGDPADAEVLVRRLDGLDDGMTAEVIGLDDVATARSVEPSASALADATANRRAKAHTIRVGVGQLDDLMDLVGELIVQKTRLRRQAGQLAALLGDGPLVTEAGDGSRQFAQIVDRLQAGVTLLRMMPIDAIFSRFPRLVRDVSSQLGKGVDLTLEGGDTELDRSLIEEVGDPLAHLVRNALDHGIESATDRIAAGKQARGQIRISARHADGRVLIEVADDGRGMDTSALSRAAIGKGLVDPAAAAAMTSEQALALVFLPGLSTAQTVTNLSGRGVGMDVVRTNVERLGGQVSIASSPGQGTTVSMLLPLTLAIIDALLVRSGDRICAVPLGAVIETQRVPRRDVRTVSGRAVLNLARGVVPLVPLREALGDIAGPESPAGVINAVLVRSRGIELGLAVDDLLGTEEIVLKSLGIPGAAHTGVAGGTILADGRVALVIDVDRLVGAGQPLLLAS